MPLLIGFVLALVIGAFAALSGFDRSRAFYPTVLIVVASYYELFAAMAGAVEALWLEALLMTAFMLLAVAAFRMSQWIAVVGLAAHGAQDSVHAFLIDNPGAPYWWPAFCGAIDVALAVVLAARLLSVGQSRVSEV